MVDGYLKKEELDFPKNKKFFTSNELLLIMANNNKYNNLVIKVLSKSVVSNIITQDISIFKKSGYAEDLYISTLALNNDLKIRIIDKPLYIYRLNNLSLTRKLNLDKMRIITHDTFLIYKFLIKTLEIKKLLTDEIKSRIMSYYSNDIFNYVYYLIKEVSDNNAKKIMLHNLKHDNELLNNIITNIKKLRLNYFKKLIIANAFLNRFLLAKIYVNIFSLLKRIR
jgi:hypothetical protein